MNFNKPNINKLVRIHRRILCGKASPKEVQYYFYWLTDQNGRVSMEQVKKKAEGQRTLLSIIRNKLGL